MKTVVIVVSLVVLIWMGFVVSFQGLDLRKWSSWLYGVTGFLSGLVLGFVLSSSLIEGLKMGAISAFMILLGGVARRRHNQKYKGMAKSLARKYGKEDPPSLFAKLVIKLFGKHK